MSSFKNSKPRRKYRERAQPQAREKLGLLEKKRDYRERAKNYHQKQDRLQELRLKASLKNEDEFYFRMLKGKNKDGQHLEFDSDESQIDQAEYRRELKTQNQTIVTMQRSIQSNKAQRLKSQLHLLDAPKPNTHKIFVETQDDLINFDLAKHYDTVPEMLDHKSNILTEEQLARMDEPPVVRVSKERYTKLAETLEKEGRMKKMMLKLQYEKNLLTKDRRRIKKSKDGNYRKFFMERKK